MVNFADDPQAMLELGLIERNTKRPITEWLNITDPVLAIDFEKAITLRMIAYDNEIEEMRPKRIAYEVSKRFGGENEEEGTTQRW